VGSGAQNIFGAKVVGLLVHMVDYTVHRVKFEIRNDIGDKLGKLLEIAL
jgi:hypothetical protein